jgi:dolichyl-phosphate-mannose--protein O-mannosyl transferase
MTMGASAAKAWSFAISLCPLYSNRRSGQQVTGYGHEDTNNHWQIIPTKALPETGRGRIVRHNDVIQLLHFNTHTHLLTHDVASPLMPTNQEFTTWRKDDHSRHNDTLFTMVLLDSHDGQAWKSKSGYFRLVHVPTKVSMWTHSKQLPDWAFKQQEINGNKNPTEKTATWFVETIVSDECRSHMPIDIINTDILSSWRRPDEPYGTGSSQGTEEREFLQEVC